MQDLGRFAHPQRCAFQPSAKGGTHPLVKALKGQPFQGSDVQRRLRQAHKWVDGKLVGSSYQCIPFRETLQLDKDSGKEFLTPTNDGPPKPAEGKGKGKRSNDHPEFTKKVCWGEPTTIPKYCVYKEDLTYLFLNQSPYVNTASQKNLITFVVCYFVLLVCRMSHC